MAGSEVHAFQCPSCGGQIELRAAGQSVVVACRHCGSVVDAANDDHKLIQAAIAKSRNKQVIALGSRGKIADALWEVIGYLERVDVASEFRWSEYLLFNPQQGFRWLTESDGHWSFVKTIKKTVEMTNSRNTVRFENSNYELFHRGKARVAYVTGEFYWLVKVGDTVRVEDYIQPPFMISIEWDKSEELWSQGTYIEPGELQRSFKLDAMPRRTGIGANQATGSTKLRGDIFGIYVLAIIALIALQFAFAASATRTRVYSERLTYSPTATEKTIVTAPFPLDGGVANVEVVVATDLMNNWLEVQGDFVEESSGETIEFNSGVEYYTGYDSDGSWSEGSPRAETLVSSVPSGKYHLNLEASVGSGVPTDYTLTVFRNVTMWANFWWALALLSLFPVFVWWRSRSVEVERWSQSDFSPYPSEGEE